MTETFCTYSKDRDELLVAYLYDDIEPAERMRFDAHLATCSRCRAEVSALTEVRTELARWSPPEPSFQAPFGVSKAQTGTSRAELHPASSPWSWWTMPVWAQVAAAMLFMGISAGVANLDVHYDRNGLAVRTGWSRARSASPEAAPPGGAVPLASALPARPAAPPDPWRADMTGLETSLRAEFQAGLRSAQTRTTSAAADPELLRRVGAMVSESERRQQRELALRVADLMRDLDTQRRADLVKIDRSLGLIQNNAGVEVLKQRELLNYLVRASQNR